MVNNLDTNHFQFNVIDFDNHSLLVDFLNNAGQSLVSFRYFTKRPLSCVKNHLVTLVLTNGADSVGYGHLDRDNGKIWLGIAVSESHLGQGLGKMIMKKLIEYGRKFGIGEIWLSVDKDNYKAQMLYRKNHFKNVSKKNSSVIFMVLNLDA